MTSPRTHRARLRNPHRHEQTADGGHTPEQTEQTEHRQRTHRQSTQNNSKRAVLAFLSLGPRAGYDIQRDIQRSIGHFWNESYGQIYPALRKIVEEGLATVRTTPQDGRPDRKVYTITDRGLETLRAWLEQPPEPPPVRNEMLLKLFAGWQVPCGTMIEHVRGLAAHFAHERARLSAIEAFLRAEAGDNEDAVYWLITLRSGQLYLDARLQWCDETLTHLERLAKPEGRKRTRPATRTKRMAKLMESSARMLQETSR